MSDDEGWLKGYGQRVLLDGQVLRARGVGKVAHFALVGHGHEGDLEVPLSDLLAVDVRPATLLKNGSIVLHTRAGGRYQLHFLKKQQSAFADLAGVLQAAVAR